jgi:hypothetical protein
MDEMPSTTDPSSEGESSPLLVNNISIFAHSAAAQKYSSINRAMSVAMK